MDYKLSRDSLKQQRFGLNTNRVEALHLRTLKLVPKHKLYLKNFSGRTHSAMLSHSLGGVLSLMKARERLNIPITSTWVYSKFMKMMNREQYFWNYHRGMNRIKQRHMLRTKLCNLKRLSKLNVVTPTHSVPSDHGYCQRLWTCATKWQYEHTDMNSLNTVTFVTIDLISGPIYMLV